jgi:hypothetical protein
MCRDEVDDMLSSSRYLLLGGLVLLGGCGGSAEVYKRETFSLDSPFQLATEVPAAVACEGARRALLGQGYVIDSANAGTVKGKKAFRGSGDETTVLELNVVCIDRGAASTVFANAIETIYSVKKSAQSASVGVSILGSVSVPLPGSSDSMVKVGDATVDDKAFYQRFFAVVQYYLAQLPPAPKPPAPKPFAEPQSPKPAAPPAATPPAAGPNPLPPAGGPAPPPPSHVPAPPSPAPAQPAPASKPQPASPQAPSSEPPAPPPAGELFPT